MGLRSKRSGLPWQQLQDSRHQVGTQRRVSTLVAATPGPIFEAVPQHDFTCLALDAKLQLADRTTHQPSDAALPFGRFAPVGPHTGRNIDLTAAMRTLKCTTRRLLEVVCPVLHRVAFTSGRGPIMGADH